MGWWKNLTFQIGYWLLPSSFCLFLRMYVYDVASLQERPPSLTQTNTCVCRQFDWPFPLQYEIFLWIFLLDDLALSRSITFLKLRSIIDILLRNKRQFRETKDCPHQWDTFAMTNTPLMCVKALQVPIDICNTFPCAIMNTGKVYHIVSTFLANIFRTAQKHVFFILSMVVHQASVNVIF